MKRLSPFFSPSFIFYASLILWNGYESVKGFFNNSPVAAYSHAAMTVVMIFSAYLYYRLDRQQSESLKELRTRIIQKEARYEQEMAYFRDRIMDELRLLIELSEQLDEEDRMDAKSKAELITAVLSVVESFECEDTKKEFQKLIDQLQKT